MLALAELQLVACWRRRRHCCVRYSGRILSSQSPNRAILQLLVFTLNWFVRQCTAHIVELWPTASSAAGKVQALP